MGWFATGGGDDALAARLAAVIALALSTSACDCFSPAYVIDGEVIIVRDDVGGAPLIVHVFEGGELGPDGAPAPRDGDTARVALATLVDGDRHAFHWPHFGQGSDAYVMAWVDLDGSSALDGLLAQETFTDDDERETPDDIELAWIRDARPSSGDDVAISPHLEFAMRTSTCDSDAARITLRPAQPP